MARCPPSPIRSHRLPKPDPQMDLLRDLNPSQREAVETLSGPLLVLAGAGTGKTRVITCRMAELIRRGTPADRILSVTFTNKAAKEMLERTRALLGGRRSQPRPCISTFHSLCVRILRQEITALGYPAKFTIYDRGDQESTARTVLRDIRVSDESLRPGDLLARISRWKMQGILPEAASEDVDGDRDFLASLAYRKYQKALRAAGAVDFDDLLLLTLQLFREFPDALTRQQQRFDHVQIDEYQDTNGIQFELVDRLVRPHQSLCVVGDDDQSIYGWRGAEVAHILGFQQHFPNAKVVRLQDNYRCTDQILELANTLVRHNRSRHEKTLVAHRPSRTDVRSLSYDSETAEAEQVVREIAAQLRQQHAAPGDFAILYRTNEQPRVFEQELRRQNVPYVLLGGQSFFDRREIRDMLAYLKVLAAPSDEMSLLRIINTPARGIGQSTVTRLLERAVRDGGSLWNVIPAAAAEGGIPARAVTALEKFRNLLERYRERMNASPQSMAQTLQALLDEIDYEAEIGRQYKDAAMQLARSASLEQMVDAVQQYVDQAAKPTLSGFLEETALDGRTEFEPDKREDQINAVRLMTLHSAKGLEFPSVYLVGMEEGLLPHRRSLDEGTESAIAEERRLCYVGITRARDQLTLTRARTRMKWGKKRPTLPSRFLFEMREEFTGDDAADEEEVAGHI